ncbi:MAG TPA: hypothetical protein VF303_04565 [Candidatus Nanoarchaeia archaeon]
MKNFDDPRKNQEEVTDKERYEKDPDEIIAELKDEFINRDADDALSRAENLGIDIDELVD